MAGVDTILKPAAISNCLHEDKAIKRCSAIFSRFDINGDGNITYEELSTIFRAVDPDHWDDQSIKRLMKAIDTSHDGVIRYEELLDWVMGGDERWADARQAVVLQGKYHFSPGDVVFVNRQTEARDEHFSVEVDLSKGCKLGVTLDSPDSTTLLVRAIKKGGLLDTWNNDNHDHEVHVGDRITEIIATIYDKNADRRKPSKSSASKTKAHIEEYKAKGKPGEMVDLLKKKSHVKLIVQPCGTTTAFALKLSDSYETFSTMHEGQIAIVKKARHKKTENNYAVKSITKAKMRKDSLQAEFEIMLHLDHPNIIGIHEVFEDYQYVHLVLQLCEGGEVLEQVLDNGGFSEMIAARFMQQALSALRYLHESCVCHRDIKAENMLIETPCALERANVKLIDFGCARKYDPNSRVVMRTITGCAEYQSYEMLSTEGYTHLCDVWSCGIIMYLLLGGYPPFMGETDYDTRRLIKRGAVDFKGCEWHGISDDAKELIKKLLSIESSRPSANEAFQHVWIKDMAPRASERSLDDAWRNIRAFSGAGRVKKLARYALAKRLTMEEVENMRNEFEIVDKNKDGHVTFHEFRTALDKHNNKMSEEMRQAFEFADLDGNMRIEYTEFLAAALDSRLSCEEHGLWMAFNVFDHDGSGMISKKELKDILSNDEKIADLGQTLGATTDSIAKLLADCDSDGDGQIDFQEFLAMMRGSDPASACIEH